MTPAGRKTLERCSPLIVLAAVLLLWELVVRLFSIPEFIFPAPSRIAEQFTEFRGALIDAAWKTFWVTMIGFGIWMVIGNVIMNRMINFRF
jgi:NitT/TauT family transport system permease protein